MKRLNRALSFFMVCALVIFASGCSEKNAVKRYDYDMLKYVSFDGNIDEIRVDTDSSEFKDYSEEYIIKIILENGILTDSYEVKAEKGNTVRFSISSDNPKATEECEAVAGDTEFKYPDIAKLIIGKKSGNQFNYTLENIDGTSAVLTVKIIAVKVPLLTEEVAKSMEYSSMEECKNSLCKEAESEFLFEKIREITVISDYPSDEYKKAYQDKIDYYTSYATDYGMSLEEYKKSKNKSDKDFDKLIKKEVQADIEKEMPVYSVFRIKKLKITEKEIGLRIKELSKNGGDSNSESTKESAERLCVEDAVTAFYCDKE